MWYFDDLEWFYKNYIEKDPCYREERELFLNDDGEFSSIHNLTKQQEKDLETLFEDFKDGIDYSEYLRGIPR